MPDNTHEKNVTDFDLLAYVDGALSPKRQEEVKAWLSENPGVKQMLDTDIESKKRLKSVFDAAVHEPVPERIMAVLEHADTRNRARSRFFANIFPSAHPWRHGLAMAGVACLFTLAGWQAATVKTDTSENTDEQTPILIGSLAQDSNLPVSAAGVEPASTHQPQQTENNSQNWLTQKIALESKAPDLSAHGFSLQDRRLVTIGDQKAVELVYTGADGTPVSLLMKARWQENPPAVKMKENGSNRVAYWEDGPLSYAINSPEMNRELGMKLAQAIKENMDGSKPEPQLDFRNNAPTDQRVRLDTLTPLQPQAPEVQQIKPVPLQVQEKF